MVRAFLILFTLQNQWAKEPVWVLSICYGIITEHGGTIHVRNVPARGASFIIQLPHQPTASLSFSMPDQKAVPVSYDEFCWWITMSPYWKQSDDS